MNECTCETVKPGVIYWCRGIDDFCYFIALHHDDGAMAIVEIADEMDLEETSGRLEYAEVTTLEIPETVADFVECLARKWEDMKSHLNGIIKWLNHNAKEAA
jgi:hypothetical protein